ncbi:TetR/AcrR family transcriptional regulator [Ruficoccus amylovorans]|uniref:TetR/AcrR family transcriptional regulator n=1 Tax=Ruficoccus amylovorans TaxID=1804625 RepID=A0A842HJQ6_9BACT|nr:TetR/AcrR family transcriptional regulator [Ruficoccus amylovorans]MBC2595391.1 TetR/AcrR family transcriptional regulator [Ruficoccus amylovorans]
MSGKSTPERLLAAAEQCYVRYGYAGTSLRELTTLAGVNLAAVNYHFGSKEALLLEMARLRIEPICREWMEFLAQSAGEEPLSLETIFGGFLRPVARQAIHQGEPNLVFLRLLGRLMNETEGVFNEVMSTFFQGMTEAFLAALGRCVPELPPEELRQRYHFAISSILGSLFLYHRLDRGQGTGFDTVDVSAFADRLRDFVCGGFRAKLPGSREGGA